MRVRTTMASDNSPVLWRKFKPRVKEINNRINEEFLSVQIYDKGLDIQNFNPNMDFEKWAAVEVTSHEDISEMEHLEVSSGRYAVFIHKGSMSHFHLTTHKIFGEWLPNSNYEFDNRPQFEIMGDKYLGPLNPASEEEIWIPIK